MKKLLKLAVCATIAGASANATMISFDTNVGKINFRDSDDYKDKTTVRFGARVEKFKQSQDDAPLALLAQLNYATWDSKAKQDEHSSATIDVLDLSLMAGYGIYTTQDIAQVQVNILGGFNYIHNTGEFRGQDENGSDTTDKGTLNSKAFKIGVSSLTTLNNTVVIGADAYVKYYLDSKKKDHELGSRTAFEADALLGYKFSQGDDGFIVGLKGGYHDDYSLGKGAHFGATIGYVF